MPVMPTDETSDVTSTATDDMVSAAVREAREWWDLGGYVDSRDYLRSPTDPPPGPGRDAALAALRAADADAEQEVRGAMRRVLEAALATVAGAPVVQGSEQVGDVG